jgi:hypothetical protein
MVVQRECRRGCEKPTEPRDAHRATATSLRGSRVRIERRFGYTLAVVDVVAVGVPMRWRANSPGGSPSPAVGSGGGRESGASGSPLTPHRRSSASEDDLVGVLSSRNERSRQCLCAAGRAPSRWVVAPTDTMRRTAAGHLRSPIGCHEIRCPPGARGRPRDSRACWRCRRCRRRARSPIASRREREHDTPVPIPRIRFIPHFPAAATEGADCSRSHFRARVQ